MIFNYLCIHMIHYEQEIRQQAVERLAAELMLAARTAPKARGRDFLHLALVTGADLSALAGQMRHIAATEPGKTFFERDAAGVEAAQALVLLGTEITALGLDCGLCGFCSCGVKPDDTPCMFNSHDLGLAVGSLVSRAADLRLDCRVMFSAGVAARRLGWLTPCAAIMGVPLSVSGKSPYFDRPAAH